MKTGLNTTQQQKSRNRLFLHGRRTALVLASLVVGFGLMMPQDSLAGKKHRHHSGRHARVERSHHGEHGHHARRYAAVSPYAAPRRGYVRDGHFNVPRRIYVRAETRRYRSYYSRRTYYAPHGHYHNFYDFPATYQGRRVHRPYAYCNGNLYGGLRLSYNRPGLSLSVGW